MPQLPNVPSVSETVPSYEYVAWNGYAVPGGIPDEVKTKLTEALAEIAKDPEVIRVLSSLGIQSVGSTPAEAEASVRKDMPIYSKIIDLAGVRKN
jgi:tripartite-type tricarboxylate transporter receptor subunit TctC